MVQILCALPCIGNFIVTPQTSAPNKVLSSRKGCDTVNSTCKVHNFWKKILLIFVVEKNSTQKKVFQKL